MNELYLTFDAKSHSTPISNLEVQFLWVGQLGCEKVVDGTFGLFPSNDVQESTIEGFPLTRRMLQKMNNLSHLRLCNQGREGIKEALDALSLGNQGASTDPPRIYLIVYMYRRAASALCAEIGILISISS